MPPCTALTGVTLAVAPAHADDSAVARIVVDLRGNDLDSGAAGRIGNDANANQPGVGLGAAGITLSQNTFTNLAYDGIDPVCTTPTTLRDTIVRYNAVHGAKKSLHDGGSLYNLSANPVGTIDHNRTTTSSAGTSR